MTPMPRQECQHFVEVHGRVEQFSPDSAVAVQGTRIVFPTPPSGARVVFLARDPNDPTHELWMLCVDTTQGGAGEFFSQPGVRQLSYQEMVSLGKQFAPEFVPPPIRL